MTRASAGLRELERFATELGWSGRRTGSGHVRWTHPEVKTALVTAMTSSGDYVKLEKRRLRKLLADARAEKPPCDGTAVGVASRNAKGPPAR